MKPWTFTVIAEVEHMEGKFASRDEVGDLILDTLTDADPGSIDGEDGGVYSIVTWDVTPV